MSSVLSVALCLISFLPCLAWGEDKDSPEAELASFKIAEGFEANLFASEADGVVKPIQMRWDARGRLWIACSPSYPQIKPGEQADDKIIVLEDSDGDGRADKSTVFASGLHIPMGLELGDGGVFVGSGGDLLHLKDTDGDLRADQREVVLRGFFSADSHQNINNFIWSPGGEMFFCQGLHIYSRVETPWGIERLNKAGIWRLRPRSVRLDPFLGDDTGPQNPFGIAFDDWGQPFMVGGNGQGVYYLKPALVRSPRKKDMAALWSTGAKFGGPDMLSGRHLPESVHGLLAAGSYINNSVYWFKLTEDGAGYKCKDQPPLIVSTHTSFRVVDLKVGPDGAIYLLDWYNPIIGHYQASFRHPGRDKTRGRVWRITAKGRPLVERPQLAGMTIPQLFEQLRSPERWTRYQAKRLLADMDAKSVIGELRTWIAQLDANDPQYEHLLVEALGVFETHELPEPELLKRVLNAKDHRARAYATGVIGRWQDRLPDALALLAERAADDHPRVRLEAVIAAACVPNAKAIEVAASVVDQPMDRFIEYALGQAVHALKPHWKPAFDSGQLALSGKRLEFVLKADGSTDVLASLMKLLKAENRAPESRANLLLAVAGVGGPDELAAVLNDKLLGAASPSTARILDELAETWRQRKVKPAGDAAPALRGMITGGGTEVSVDSEARPGVARAANSRAARGTQTKAAALRLAGLWNVEALFPVIAEAASDAAKSADERRAAFEGLSNIGGEKALALLRTLAGPEATVATRTLAACALARVDLKAAAAVAAAIMGAPGSDPAPIVAAFLERQGGAEALAAALEKEALGQDAARLGLRALSSAGRQDATLKNVLAKAAKISNEAPEYSAELVKSLAEETMQKGDAARGEAVFHGALTNCLSCHAIGGAGGKAGPDLSAIGTGMPLDLLVEAVLWPNRQVKEGYMSTLVVTKDGQIHQGIRAGESAQELSLRDADSNSIRRIPAKEIKTKRDIGSAMPDGLTSGLTRGEVCDLIRFLSELGRPGPFRVENKPAVRRWLVAPAVGQIANLPGEVSDPSLWQPRYSFVSGQLPFDAVFPSERAQTAWVKFEAQVIKGGRFHLRLNALDGLALWVDGNSVAVKDPIEIALEPGAHAFLLRVDRPARGGKGIACQCEPAPQSAGEMQVVGGK